jgi:hypothetical protein
MGLAVEEAADGFLDSWGDGHSEGLANLVLGEARLAGGGEGGAGGEDPDEGVGEAAGGRG